MEISQPFRSCEMSVRGCEMALMCQRGVSQLRKFSQRGGVGLRNNFTAKWHFCSGFLGLRNNFAAKWQFRRGLFLAAKFRRPLFFPCFNTFSCSKRLSFNFFAIPPDFDHPKTYITSKQIRIKALKSKLKQVINKTKRYGLASL